MSAYLFGRSIWTKGENRAASPDGWGAGRAAAGLGLALLLAGVIGLALLPTSLAWSSDDPEYLVLAALGTLAFELGLFAIVWRLTLSRGAGFNDLGLRFHGWRVTSALGTLLLSYAALYSYVLAVNLIGLSGLEPEVQVSDAAFDHAAVVAILGISVILAAPFVEELFFRGFVFRGFANTLGVWPGALLSGLIFSLAHLNLGAIVPFTLIGAVFALSYQRTRSLWTPISAHFAFNLISFSILVLVPEARA